MPIKTNSKRFEKGLTIFSYGEPSNRAAAPTKIEVTHFDELWVGAFTSYAEFIARRIVYKEMESVDYVVDRMAAWEKIDFKEKTVKIIVIGDKARKNLIKLLKFLTEKYDLGINQIFFSYEDSELFETLRDKIGFKEIEEPIEIFEVEEQIIKPTLQVKYYYKGEWTDTPQERIEKIDINVNHGDVRFRVFTRGSWMPWKKGNGITGADGYYIKGFQFYYEYEHYKILTQITTIDGSVFKWNFDSDKPLRTYIKDIKFKVVDKDFV